MRFFKEKTTNIFLMTFVARFIFYGIVFHLSTVLKFGRNFRRNLWEILWCISFRIYFRVQLGWVKEEYTHVNDISIKRYEKIYCLRLCNFSFDSRIRYTNELDVISSNLRMYYENNARMHIEVVVFYCVYGRKKCSIYLI